MSLRSSIWGRLLQGFQRLPVSGTLLLVCAVLHGSYIYLSLFPQEQGAEGARPGALHVLRLVEYPEVDGFFELWQGQWWRLPISALHHVDLIHLLGNAFGLWILGGMLEPRLGRIRYAAFLAGGLIVSLIPEAAVEQPALGISGLVYAMFGLLLVLRTQDAWIYERFHPTLITLGFIWLFLCIPLTVLDVMPIANGGHLCGIVYGAVTGWICCVVMPRRLLAGWSMLVAVHLAIAAGLATLTAPIWNGRYWAWKAVTSNRPDLWQKAVQRDPRMTTGWAAMIEARRTSGDPAGAWQAALQAIQSNPGSTSFDATIRNLFRHGFQSAEERAAALDSLQAQFGDESSAWIRRLRLPAITSIDGDPVEPLADLPPLDAPFDALGHFFGLSQHVPGITRSHEDVRMRPTVNPDDPHSARSGEVL